MITAAASFFALFALLSLTGGVLGFRRAGSRASLLAGGISGLLLGVAALLLFFGSSEVGLIVGAVTSLLLAGRFVPAFMKTRKVMPAGMMGACALMGLILVAVAW